MTDLALCPSEYGGPYYNECPDGSIVEDDEGCDITVIGTMPDLPPEQQGHQAYTELFEAGDGTTDAIADLQSPCVIAETCTPVDVLFATTRAVKWGESAELEGDIGPANDPFSRRKENPDFETQKGFMTISVPVKQDNLVITRPRPHQTKTVFGIPYASRPGDEIDGAAHYVYHRYGALSDRDFFKVINEEPEAFVYIHGFRESQMSAAFKAAQIKVNGDFAGNAVIFSWPSMESISPNDYRKARDHARKSAPALAVFLEDLSYELGTDKIHVIAHSMGNYLLQQAFDHIADSPDVGLNQLVMAAPDISSTNYTTLVNTLEGRAKGITLYTSRSDVILGISEAVCKGEKWFLNSLNRLTSDQQSYLSTLDCNTRAGYIPRLQKVPYLVKGVDSIDASLVKTSRLLFNPASWHGYAFEDDTIANDISSLLRSNGSVPVNERSAVDCLDPNEASCPAGDTKPDAYFWRFRAD